MKRSGIDAGTCRHAHHYIGVFPPAVMTLRQVVDDLVKTARHKISELHFHNRFHSVDGKSETRTDDRGFANRCVAHASFSKLFYKTRRGFKYTAVFGNVLSHDDEILVPFHGLVHAI